MKKVKENTLHKSSNKEIALWHKNMRPFEKSKVMQSYIRDMEAVVSIKMIEIKFKYEETYGILFWLKWLINGALST